MANPDAPALVYDVFLSFRGSDARHAFTDHLHHALINKGINTFRDEHLRRGDEIAPNLLDAIERSRMSIVVLSQNYASSSWCLDELVRILEISDNGRNRPVLPIFYHVDPSDVRHQTNQYAEAMTKHENGINAHKVPAWRSALSVVSSISGHLCTANTNEAEIISKIVEEVAEKLRPAEPVNIN